MIPAADDQAAHSGTLTILLGGTNEGNMDAMILVHVDIPRERITLLSVPRDLFYNGRKINSAYSLYGIDELKRELKEITGYTIDRYAVIDMYAFIEVVDLIGGIDVTLDSAVIDPSYKTFDYGQWGTLYFGVGQHHLSGTQALRLGRSRHYSSDFERAKRQQQILTAVREKFANLNVGDAAKVAEIGQAVLSKTTTDLTFKEALTLYLRFLPYKLRTGFVLDTTNVFKSKTLEEAAADEAQDKCYKQLPGTTQVNEIPCPPRAVGQYILIPLKDWDDVKKAVAKVFEN